MVWFKKKTEFKQTIACCIDDGSYSIAVVGNNKKLLFSQYRTFTESTRDQISKALGDDIERLGLLAHSAQLILLPGQYQLILMDALNVPEAEMAKALQWSLKGLSDYDLDDVALDTFLMPSRKNSEQKKVLVALTPVSVLNKKNSFFEAAFLDVISVGISAVALKTFLSAIMPTNTDETESPIFVISIWNTIRKLHIVYNDMFYLIRELTPSQHPHGDEPAEMANILLELEHSIDYCINKLNIPEPRQVLFTPGFHRAVSFFKQIEEEFELTVSIIDLNQHMEMTPALSLEEQDLVFYSIIGAFSS